MIMHHMNTDAHKVDLVELKLDTDDVDGDGLSMSTIGPVRRPDHNRYPLNTDTDKDGATDADELAAGTDPEDPDSVFFATNATTRLAPS